MIGVFLGAMALHSESEGVEQPRPLPPIDVEKLPRQVGEPQTLLEFFGERTRVGYGFEETYNDNLLLQEDNKKQKEELISTLESEIFFTDPRGAVLYGADWEVNAFRYHHRDLQAINHDAKAFLDVDPGGRYKYGLQYKLNISNSLVFGPEQIDLLRRSSKFQKIVDQDWNGKVTFALNKKNNLVPQLEYETFDDHSATDASTDHNQLRAIVDIDHDLKPEWVLFGGYEFGDVQFPKNDLKNFQSHALRFGTRYGLTELVDLELLFKMERHEFESGGHSTSPGTEGKWTYQAGPRTTLSLKFSDGRGASYSSERLQFRSSGASGEIRYQLTPLTELTLGGGFEKQQSDRKDALSGTTSAAATKSSRYSFTTGTLWQFRHNAHVELGYSLNRSKTSDYTSHVVRLSIEAAF